MTISMSNACTMNVPYPKEQIWWLIDNSTAVIIDSIEMLQLVVLFAIVIYDHHIL